MVPGEKAEKGKRDKSAKGARRQAGDHAPEAGYARLFITLGKADGFYAREIIGYVNRHVEGPKIEMGRIDLRPRFSFFEVPEAEAPRIIKAMQGLEFKGRRVGVDLAELPKNGGEVKRGGRGQEQGVKKNRAQRRQEQQARQQQAQTGKGKKRRQVRPEDFAPAAKRKDDWKQFFRKS
ncbi:MAG: DbpA RNA binding domain-containing protein [Bacteroidaceae bacterium]|nr:DbpA RNA binding domain-containing protein [Bacteroidaceae bacterium]